MKKIFLLFLFFIFTCNIILAQRPEYNRFEVFFGGGANLIFLDIGDGGVGYAGFFAARYYVNENLTAGINLAYATGSDKDEDTNNSLRNYSINTTLVESTVRLNYFFFHSDFSGRRDRKGRVLNVPRIRLYAFVGAGTVFYNPDPVARNQDHTFDEDYSKISLIIPYGLGMQYRLTRKLAASFEVGRRYTTTDYLDGFSPEPSNELDMYYFVLLGVSYRFSLFN